MIGREGPGPATTNPADAIEQAAILLAEQPAEAARRAEALLATAPNDPRLLLILGSARRRLGDARGALAVLTPLAKAYPKAARTQYEHGASLLALGQTPAALPALRAAVTLNPDLAEAWRALGDLLFRDGDVAGAEAAYARHGHASVRDPQLRPAADAILAGRLDEAEMRLRQALAAAPGAVEAMRLLCEILIRQERHAEAEIIAARALEIEPGHDGLRFSYATALFRQQKAAEAVAQVEQLLASDQKDPAYRNLMAGCLSLLGEDEQVIGLYEQLLAEYPRQPQIWLNQGHALRAVGRGAEAVAAYRRCIALGPNFTDAYLGLANLKVAAFTDTETAAMAALAQRGDLSAKDRIALSYALGQALEDRDDPAAAFAHYARGAVLKRAETPYDPELLSDQVRRSKALFTQAFFARSAGSGSRSTAPIFIVGLPRSGSTLIEQILASHSAVEGTMELPDIGLIAGRLKAGGAPYPELLADLAPGALTALGEGYLNSTAAHRKLGRAHFIDKMPNNFTHIGLIQLILPQAIIIDARRHPLGAGFSAFKQHFAQGQAFSYELADIGRYYRDYWDLMTHVDAVLPGRVLRVIYEDLVEDTEGQVRRMLDHCRLPFEDGCLRFYENDRAVRTVSSEQVRRPIFREGLEQWRRFEPWLEPMKAALGPALVGWRE